MIYFVSAGGLVTGGPETLHQAAKVTKDLGYDVSMYYVDPHKTECPDRFKEYNIHVSNEIVDIKSNVIIVPETLTFVLKKLCNVKVCIWWLSLDNYIRMTPVGMTKWRMEKHNISNIYFPVVFITFLLKRKFHLDYYRFNDKGKYMHAYNCEYAHRYIIEHGVPEKRTIYLCGPLNKSFFEKAKSVYSEKRNNIILYNPKKGIEFTQKLISAAKEHGLDAEFRPIQNMTPDQIIELMSRSKIYIDFGNFPGPERIPREAVMMGCNIITSKNGAAANEIDVPIPEKLKFEDKEENIPEIIKILQDMLMNYDVYYHYYDKYREKVVGQVELLQKNAELLLERI